MPIPVYIQGNPMTNDWNISVKEVLPSPEMPFVQKGFLAVRDSVRCIDGNISLADGTPVSLSLKNNKYSYEPVLLCERDGTSYTLDRATYYPPYADSDGFISDCGFYSFDLPWHKDKIDIEGELRDMLDNIGIDPEEIVFPNRPPYSPCIDEGDFIVLPVMNDDGIDGFLPIFKRSGFGRGDFEYLPCPELYTNADDCFSYPYFIDKCKKLLSIYEHYSEYNAEPINLKKHKKFIEEAGLASNPETKSGYLLAYPDHRKEGVPKVVPKEEYEKQSYARTSYKDVMALILRSEGMDNIFPLHIPTANDEIEACRRLMSRERFSKSDIKKAAVSCSLLPDIGDKITGIMKKAESLYKKEKKNEKDGAR